MARRMERRKKGSKMSQKPVYIVDGAKFSTLEEFYDEIDRALNLEADWGCNLDAFEDILGGGFGTPDGGFVIRWINCHLSRDRLGYEETARQLELRLERCHPSNRELVLEELRRAKIGEGPTVFDWLVGIVEIHCANGRDLEDCNELLLE